MRYFFLILALLFPSFSFAACTQGGATIVYVNGIFTSEEKAKDDLKNLRTNFVKFTRNKEINFTNGYNPSHLAGAADVAQSAAQMFGTSISNYDLHTILLQIYPEVQTRKLLLVGHSQGAFYTNLLHDYLVSHGEPQEAVGVYQIGTPANFVAGEGRYVNSSNDNVINTLRELAGQLSALPPLPANVDLPSGKGNGHGISDVYLAYAPERVVGDMQDILESLEPTLASETGNCFTPPTETLGYQAGKILFSVADPAALAFKNTGQIAVAATKKAFETGQAALNKVIADIGTIVGGFRGLSKATTDEVRPTNFNVVKSLYGSSLSPEDVKEILGNQGGAAVLAGGEVLGTSTEVVEEKSPVVKKRYVSRSSSRDRNSEEEPEEEIIDLPQNVDTPTITVDNVASTSDENMSVEAAVPILFTSTTTAPVLTPQDCTVALFYPHMFGCTNAQVAFVWDAVPGAAVYELWRDSSVLEATTSDTNITVTFDTSVWDHAAFLKAYDTAGQLLESQALTLYFDVKRDGVPLVVSVTPARGETQVATSTPLEVTFDGPLPTGHVSSKNIAIVGIDNWIETSNANTIPDDPVLYIYTNHPLACGSRYYLYVNWALNAHNSGFTTVACPVVENNI